jgi:hypothetical protein
MPDQSTARELMDHYVGCPHCAPCNGDEGRCETGRELAAAYRFAHPTGLNPAAVALTGQQPASSTAALAARQMLRAHRRQSCPFPDQQPARPPTPGHPARLIWDRLPDGSADIASGRDCVYLVTGKPGEVTLTRVRLRPDMTPTEAAVQAARNAIKIHPKAAGQDAPFGSDLQHARQMAQQYEDGEPFFLIPAWQHEES